MNEAQLHTRQHEMYSVARTNKGYGVQELSEAQDTSTKLEQRVKELEGLVANRDVRLPTACLPPADTFQPF